MPGTTRLVGFSARGGALPAPLPPQFVLLIPWLCGGSDQPCDRTENKQKYTGMKLELPHVSSTFGIPDQLHGEHGGLMYQNCLKTQLSFLGGGKVLATTTSIRDKSCSAFLCPDDAGLMCPLVGKTGDLLPSQSCRGILLSGLLSKMSRNRR